MARFKWGFLSVGFARQSALNTENTTDADFSYFAAEVDVPEINRQIFDIAAKTGQVGADQAPAVGVKRATVKIKMPLYGFKRSFSSATEEPGITDGVISAAQVFLGLVLGSNSEDPASATDLRKGVGLSRSDFTANFGATFANNTVNAIPSATTVTVQAGEGAKYIPGQMVVWGSSLTDTAQAVSWVKSVAVDTLTLVDAPGNTPQANDDGFPSVVAYQSSQQPAPMTLRLLGDNAAFKVALFGAIPSKCMVTCQAGEPPMCEFEFACVGATTYGTGGGLVALTVDPQLPLPVVGNFAGRLTWAAVGSAMAVLHGVRDLKIEIAHEFSDVLSHNVASGISERIVANRKIKVDLQIPRDSSDTITSGDGPWDTAIGAGTSYQLAVYGGKLPGTIFSLFAPSLHLADAPKPVEVDGLIYDALSFRPGTYTADSGSGDAADSNFRLGWA